MPSTTNTGSRFFRCLRFAVAGALIVSQFVFLLVPQLYSRASPRLAGIPFFYWYQLLWTIVGMAFMVGVYMLTPADSSRPAGVTQ